jgi:hypothetical protein
MADEQSRRVWDELAEITDRLRRFERDMGYGPDSPMDPDFGYEPAWKDDDDMPDDLRAMFERMERVDREYDDEPPPGPEYCVPELASIVLDDYEHTTGKSVDYEFGNALIDMSFCVGLAREASGERGYLDLFSKAGRKLRREISFDKIKLVNGTQPEDYEEFPPLANLLRDVQQAYGNLRITDV